MNVINAHIASRYRYQKMSWHLLIALALMPAGLFAQTQNLNPAPQLFSDSSVSSAGFFRLSWKTNAKQLELQESTQPAFTQSRTYAINHTRGIVMSGKKNGVWYYRIRTVNPDQQKSPWSNLTVVTVSHHSLTRALLFFALGFVVFIATTLMIVFGSKATA